MSKFSNALDSACRVRILCHDQQYCSKSKIVFISSTCFSSSLILMVVLFDRKKPKCTFLVYSA